MLADGADTGHDALVLERSAATPLVVAAASLVGLTGCQDTVSLGFENPCPFDVEVLEESIRLGDDDVRYHVVNVGSIEKVLVDSPDWTAEQLRVRRNGSDELGQLVVADRSSSTVPDDDSFDFVVSMDPSICEHLR